MQKTVIKEIICPKCNQITEGKLYTSVNATNNPHLRNEILEENLFRWRCHSCGHEVRLNYPLLYNDMQKRFMIYHIPEIDRFQLADNELEEEFAKDLHRTLTLSVKKCSSLKTDLTIWLWK